MTPRLSKSSFVRGEIRKKSWGSQLCEIDSLLWILLTWYYTPLEKGKRRLISFQPNWLRSFPGNERVERIYLVVGKCSAQKGLVHSYRYHSTCHIPVLSCKEIIYIIWASWEMNMAMVSWNKLVLQFPTMYSHFRACFEPRLTLTLTFVLFILFPILCKQRCVKNRSTHIVILTFSISSPNPHFKSCVGDFGCYSCVKPISNRVLYR